MPHEVVKRVGGRAYRYLVESYRDPQSGKVRGRWTYLGRVEGGAPPRRRRPAETRERLLAAFGRLLERAAYDEISAGRIAEEAGLAHGTFYRHFPDKAGAFRAALDRLRERLDSGVPWSDSQLGSVEDERRRVRDWVGSLLAVTIERPGLLRAAYTAAGLDPIARSRRLARRSERVAEWTRYLVRLAQAGFIAPAELDGLANALVATLDGLLRLSILDGVPIDEMAVGGAIALFDRAIFGGDRSKPALSD